MPFMKQIFWEYFASNNGSLLVFLKHGGREEHGDVGWNDLKEQLTYAKKPCPTMKTIGYLVHKGKDPLFSLIKQSPCLKQ